VTALLGELSRGNEAARELVYETVYEELRALAQSRLRLERGDLTLGTTALVHEAYLRLVPLENLDWPSRSHFFGVAARAMRRVLIDHARTARRLKRGGGRRPVSMDDVPGGALAESVALDADDLLALDEALDRLGALSERQRQVVELRFFAGLSLEEVADVLSVGLSTVKRDWSTARAWLNRELAA
jgi:RNA polymerase sigma factor (TIGR02999 family)